MELLDSRGSRGISDNRFVRVGHLNFNALKRREVAEWGKGKDVFGLSKCRVAPRRRPEGSAPRAR